jgi:hypothetical protein
MKTAAALLLLVLPFGSAACRRETGKKPDRAVATVPAADAAGGPIDRTPQCTRQPLPGDVPVLPDGVLLQSLVVSEKGLETGLRIHDDGRLESKSVGLDWASGKVLPPDQLQTVRQAIVDARLGQVAVYHRAIVPREGMGVNWLEVRDGGAVVVVAMDDACFVPEVQALMVKLVLLFD